MNIYKLASEEILKCVKCGACRNACPVVREVNREHGMARGKIALSDMVLSGGTAISDRIRVPIEQCLLCRSCIDACANSVNTDSIMIVMRELIAREKSRPLHIALTNGILASRFSGVFFKMLSFMQPFVSHFLPVRFYPPIAKNPFIENTNEITEGHLDKRILYYAGCLNNFIFPQISAAAFKILKNTGSTLIVPKKQACCGLPHLSLGDIETAKNLALKNISVMESFRPDSIVVSCASCGSMLKKYYPLIFRGTPHEESAVAFSRMVTDITEIITASPDMPLRKNNGYKTITFHDPCHLKRGMGIFKQPRNLLTGAGYELREMEDSDSCCGFGGTFSLKYPEISMGILSRKVSNAESTGADVIATSCPGCIMQIMDGVRRSGSKIRIKHILELIA
ncbi:MAG TPA: (Fe-S)-binding protein [bacterium]